jgi:hypothetical protein
MLNNGTSDEMMMTLVGSPASRRVQGFVAAAARVGWQVDVVSYADVIKKRCRAPTGIVRLDSPGECVESSRLILRAGIEPLSAAGGRPLGGVAIERLPFERGALLAPRQWYFGFRHVLERLEVAWEGAVARWMSRPGAVATAFDKLATLEQWAGLPTPARTPQVWSYAQLRDVVRTRHARLFLKLRYGYAAMGAIALEWRGERVRAITTVEIVSKADSGSLYVSKNPRILRDEADVAWLVDTLAREELLVEEWLPKARWQGRPFDIRVVVIGGVAMHAVGRASASPFTNLNLDATRISKDALIAETGDRWPAIERLCEAAAARLPDAGMLGIDVLIRSSGRGAALLEANAFGDYLPGLQCDGLSTWDAELRWLGAVQEAVA